MENRRGSLIPKTKKPGEDDKYRPICLLNEIAKVFERIIAFRINKFMADNEHAQLAKHQYGFRHGHSTIDALLVVKKAAESAINNKQFAIALALDIKNAFNTLPWDQIVAELKRKNYPKYLVNIIASYLSNRKICYIGCDTNLHMRNMTSGVPQGSILGLLWNVTYNRVLESAKKKLLDDCQIICYADDTIILTKDTYLRNALNKANICAVRVIKIIEDLGLKVSPEKTEAMLFSRNKTDFGPLVISLRNRDIPVTRCLKYLGVMLDSALNFKDHFRYMEEKASRVIRALWKLMPNLKGPGENKRKLYLHVVHSVLLYGAPVWSERFAASRLAQAPIRRLQKSIALRVIRGYKTIAYEAAILLARIPPLYLMAAKYRRSYEKYKELINSEEDVTAARKREIRTSSEILLRRQWKAHLRNPDLPGLRVRSYILPIFEDWLDREHGSLTFYLTQLITGHGSFGAFLARIGKISTPICQYCYEEDDTAQHVISVCPNWENERESLRGIFGEDLSLEAIMNAIVRDVNKWETACSFARIVLQAKEHDDYIREKAARDAEYFGVSESSTDSWRMDSNSDS